MEEIMPKGFWVHQFIGAQVGATTDESGAGPNEESLGTGQRMSLEKVL